MQYLCETLCGDVMDAFKFKQLIEGGEEVVYDNKKLEGEFALKLREVMGSFVEDTPSSIERKDTDEYNHYADEVLKHEFFLPVINRYSDEECNNALRHYKCSMKKWFILAKSVLDPSIYKESVISRFVENLIFYVNHLRDHEQRNYFTYDGFAEKFVQFSCTIPYVLGGSKNLIDSLEGKNLKEKMSILSILPSIIMEGDDSIIMHYVKLLGFNGDDVYVINRGSYNLKALFLSQKGKDDKATTFIVVRGTDPSSIKNIKIDLSIGSSTFTCGSKIYDVHGGFNKGAHSLWDESLSEGLGLGELLSACRDNLYFVGHSLGGAISLILACKVKYAFESKDLDISLYTYGQPMVFISEGPRMDDMECWYHRLVNLEDKVTIVPRPTFNLKYKHFGKAHQYVYNEQQCYYTYSNVPPLPFLEKYGGSCVSIIKILLRLSQHHMIKYNTIANCMALDDEYHHFGLLHVSEMERQKEKEAKEKAQEEKKVVEEDSQRKGEIIQQQNQEIQNQKIKAFNERVEAVIKNAGQLYNFFVSNILSEEQVKSTIKIESELFKEENREVISAIFRKQHEDPEIKNDEVLHFIDETFPNVDLGTKGEGWDDFS